MSRQSFRNFIRYGADNGGQRSAAAGRRNSSKVEPQTRLCPLYTLYPLYPPPIDQMLLLLTYPCKTTSLCNQEEVSTLLPNYAPPKWRIKRTKRTKPPRPVRPHPRS